MSWRRYLFSFQGRLNRVAYWRLALVSGLASGAAMAASWALVMTGLPGWPPFAALLVLVVPAVAVPVKRLHDRNRSGWWLLPFSVLPLVLTGFAQWGAARPNLVWPALAMSLAGLALAIWGWIEIGFLRGTRGPNRYGEPV